MDLNNEIKKLKKIFELYPEIKLVYFFGSRVVGASGPRSDYDFAVYLDEKNKKKMFDIKFDIQSKIARRFKTDKIDIVVLNITESPELKFSIIKEGKLIFEKGMFKVLVEPKILNEYFDFHHSLLRHNLTKF